MAKFDHLQRLDPKGRTATMPLPIAGYTNEAGVLVPATLDVLHAGEGNKPWHSAVTRFNAKNGVVRKSIQGRPEVGAMIDERDLDLYPKHIVTGWGGIVDGDGELVPFSEDVCREFLRALPPWIMDEVRGFVSNASNFLADDLPTREEVDEQAGK